MQPPSLRSSSRYSIVPLFSDVSLLITQRRGGSADWARALASAHFRFTPLTSFFISSGGGPAVRMMPWLLRYDFFATTIASRSSDTCERSRFAPDLLRCRSFTHAAARFTSGS